MPIKSRIRSIPDYPKKGILVRDITTLLKDPVGFRLVIDSLNLPVGMHLICNFFEEGKLLGIARHIQRS